MRIASCKRCGLIFRSSGTQAYCPACRHAVKSGSVIRSRVCIDCGIAFNGYPKSKRCPDCADKREKERQKSYRQHGFSRPIGSTDLCQNCGNPYTVESGMQRYCKDCSMGSVQKNIQIHKKEYMSERKSESYQRKLDLSHDRKVCVICGATFTGSGVQTTCSAECAALRRKEWQRTVTVSKGITRKADRFQAHYSHTYIGTFRSLSEAIEAREKFIFENVKIKKEK